MKLKVPRGHKLKQLTPPGLILLTGHQRIAEMLADWQRQFEKNVARETSDTASKESSKDSVAG